GMGIPVGKLTLSTAGSGIHPGSCLPIDVDVGTGNEELLADPLYLGLRQPRLTGEPYFSLLDELVEGIRKVFPRAIVQWEDFANDNAFQVLERYRSQLPSFDDDIQGTGAVVVAGLRTALSRAGRNWRDERVVFFGAGASGGGCAFAVHASLRALGMSEPEIRQRVLCLDSKGLILEDRPGLDGHKRLLAAPATLVKTWSGGKEGIYRLADVVRNFKPTILVGASGQPGTFTEDLVREMHAHCPRPIILPLSNPTSKSEATPEDVLRWTEGKALVASGSPNARVQCAGQEFEIGQANNVLIFPGLGLGAIAVEAREIPDEVLLAAADALFETTQIRDEPGAPLYPSIAELRRVSRAVASAVATSLVKLGSAPACDEAEIQDRISALVWEPRYDNDKN
ncbi:MAG: oxaloacetate-decarboxylating malate dehydrogenase, partial [Planctomycetes bacterium]|nr:oxaloacetate-decarboxylating malate dehydrogenase [Planctomycetota bacterium]